MKKIILQFTILLLSGLSSLAQSPQQFNYQGIARDASGSPLASQPIGLRLTIHDGSSGGTSVYQETFSITTNTFGLYNVAVGGGTVISGTFSSINWGSGGKYIQVEIDPAGGTSYTSLGASQLLSVPYALYAGGSASPGVTSVSAGAGLAGGTITSSGTIGLDTAGTAGTYGSATQVPVIVTDAYGRVTSATNTSISFPSGWLLTGNSGTSPTTNFIGTTDAQPLEFRVNNIGAGQINQLTHNTALGYNAASSISIGASDVAIGEYALSSNTIGSYNTATGVNSLKANTTGNNNAANGFQSLYLNTTGFNNTASGSWSLYSNTTASNNTATGYQSLYLNTTGALNTATGSASLYSNTTGSNNNANGVNCLLSNTTGSYNTAIGPNSLYDNTTGNGNTAIGGNSLSSNTTGSGNTAIGDSSLQANTASRNTGVGYQSMMTNTTGGQNTGVGYQSLYLNTTGNNNVANGYQSLLNNTTGSTNVGIGVNALIVNTSGSNNTALGTSTLYSNVSGADNVAVGANCLQNNTADYNTGVGYQSLVLNTTGNLNTVLGYQAGYSNTTGTHNTAVGAYALLANVDGGYNTGVGQNAYPSEDSLNNWNGFGYNAGASWSVNNSVELGNASIGTIRAEVGLTVVSDGRIKDNVTENVPGLAFITKLRPVTYNLNIHRENEILYKDKKGADQDWEGKYDLEKITQSGFIAQEVDQAAKDAGYDFSGITHPATPDGLYGLRYEDFVIPLVKAVQEQQQTITTLQTANSNMQTQLNGLQKRLEALEGKK